MNFVSKHKEIIILLACLLGLSLLYNYQYAFSKGPYSFHMWRQTDCLALTQGYYENGLKFFEPSMSYMSGGNGKAVAEFPLLYYINATLWTIFGKSEMLYRILNVLITFIGLVYLYKLIRVLLGSVFWARVLTLLVFTSPIYVFYANGFLVNVPAISFIFIAWYFFYQFYIVPTSNKALILSILFITIATLLRVTLFYAVSFIYITYFLETLGIGSFGKNGKLYLFKIKQALILLIPLLCVFSWVSYARYYNTLHGTTEIFLMKIIPVWEKEYHEFIDITRQFVHVLAVEVLLSYVGMYMCVVLLVFLSRHVFKLNKVAIVCLFSLSLGCLSYILLFYQNLDVHDYYLLDVIPFIVMVFVFFILLLQKHFYNIYQSYFFKVFFLFFLFTSIVFCTAKHRIKYRSQDDAFVNALFFMYTDERSRLWDWYHWDYGMKLEALEDIESKLRKLGIKKNDLVLSIPDISPNTTLYMMGQKGYSNYGNWGLSTYDQILKAQKNKVKYLILNDSSVLYDDRGKKIVGKPIAEIKNIVIYDIEKRTHLNKE